MSDLRKTSRLLIVSGRSSVLVILALTGCSSFSGFRSGVADSSPKMKTFLAVGDKPMPVVIGEPGSSIAADESAPSIGPRRASNAENRVSGRVYDESGDPVDGAAVRLAVNGVPGGRVSRVTTDPSGGFTLRGLRPGSSYTVIAEWEGNDGPMSGRTEARTSDTELKITLAPLDARSDEGSGGSRVNRVSNPADLNAEMPGPRETRISGRPVVNEEDLPPAIEADAMESPSRGPRATAIDRESKAWEGGNSPTEGTESADAPSPAEFAPRPSVDDDGPNPLPPAIEPATAPKSNAEPITGREVSSQRGRQTAQRDPDDFLPPAAAPSRRSRRAKGVANSAAEIAKQDDDTIPGALVVVPKTFAPIVIDDSGDTPAPEATSPAPVSRNKPATRLDTPAPRPVTKPKPRTGFRPTWGDVVTSASEMPPLQGIEPREELPQPPEKHLDADDSAPDWTKPPAMIPASEPDPIDESPISAADLDPAPSEVHPRSTRLKDDATVLCDYDARLRRINDFRLPDLRGRPVRFKDLDADLILLDFWGTWCQPCLRSIPKLVELQAKNPGKKLVVVGIACEQGDIKDASRKVAATAQQLKINYPILMSRNDGSCPLQEALHIQAFPTLVLVDREGRVVWRDQGATPATIARLERLVLEAAPRKAAASRSHPGTL